MLNKSQTDQLTSDLRVKKSDEVVVLFNLKYYDIIIGEYHLVTIK